MEWTENLILNASHAGVDKDLLCFPHEPDSCSRTARFDVIRVAMYILMLPTVLMTVLGNLLVILTILHFKQLRSPTNFIILSLAIVDCLLGSMIMPFSMVRWVEGCWFLGEILCKIHTSLDMTLSIVSILHLCLVSVDRYMAITDPLVYKMK
ncbi:trace amine-associated receptor 4-like, partial [Clarias magur]